MELKLFGFIEDVLDKLEEDRAEYEEVAERLEAYFEDMLIGADKGYLNISTRVKSSYSLKEKIIRNQYYQKYKTREQLFENVPDIIGMRIECRFIQDEGDIYRLLKKVFNKSKDGLYYMESNENIFLNLTGKQPQEQKNGLKIFRIDGKYRDNEISVNFELQIKSLVNVFWGEIEHKVIYKNFNYVIADRFYKDIMKSINTSLKTIDQQLLLISNQYEQEEEEGLMYQEKHFEDMLAKIVYDIFAKCMKESIGVLVDFRASCQAIVRYVFRDTIGSGGTFSQEQLLLAFDKVRNVDKDFTDFKMPLEFDAEPDYETECARRIGSHIQERLNEEFQWNLFFRILFAIEPESNRGDFENYMRYYTNKIYYRCNFNKLRSEFTEEEVSQMIDEIMFRFAECFININSVDMLYDNIIDKIIKNMNGTIDDIYKNIITFEEWESQKYIYLNLLEAKLLLIFKMDINPDKAMAIVNDIKKTGSNIEIPKGLIKSIYL